MATEPKKGSLDGAIRDVDGRVIGGPRRPNISGRALTRPVTHKPGAGGSAGVSLNDQLHTAEKFMQNPNKWPRTSEPVYIRPPIGGK